MTPTAALVVFLSSLLLSVTAVDIQGKIEWNEHCPDLKALGPSKIILDNDALSGGVTRDGSFIIPDVPVGVYVLQVVSHNYPFDALRVDVLNGTSPEVRPYTIGTPLDPPSVALLSYPPKLSPKQPYVYYVPPESFNLLAMFKNPMMLMMVFGGGMMLAMPYLMKNMDPEALEDFQGQQAKMAKLQSTIASGDFSAGFSALMNGNLDDTPAVAASPPAAGTKKMKASGKNRKR